MVGRMLRLKLDFEFLCIHLGDSFLQRLLSFEDFFVDCILVVFGLRLRDGLSDEIGLLEYFTDIEVVQISYTSSGACDGIGESQNMLERGAEHIQEALSALGIAVNILYCESQGAHKIPVEGDT